jgi:hypothetical protein
MAKAKFVPIVEVPMTIVLADDREGFETNLRALLRHELVAFIVQWGAVDPTIVNPRIYVGSVAAGQSVISSGDSGKFAAWHRYDTNPDLGYRNVAVSDIMTEYQYPDPRGYDLESTATSSL